MKEGEHIEYYSSEVESKDGEYIEYYDTGEILSKCNYLDGKRHGSYISYFKSGEIWSKINYLDCKFHGEHISYYSSGEVSIKSYNINGNVVSELEWISYSRNIKLGLLVL